MNPLHCSMLLHNLKTCHAMIKPKFSSQITGNGPVKLDQATHRQPSLLVTLQQNESHVQHESKKLGRQGRKYKVWCELTTRGLKRKQMCSNPFPADNYCEHQFPGSI